MIYLEFLKFYRSVHKENCIDIKMTKRAREPDEAPEQTNKQRRVLKKSQSAPDPAPQQHLRDGNQEELGRPGQSSYPVPQAALHHQHPPAQSPSQQAEQGRRPSLHQSRPSPPNVQLPSEQPREGGEGHENLTSNPPRLQDVPVPSQARPFDLESSDSETSTRYSQESGTYDVGQDIRAVGTPQTGEIENWGQPQTLFIRSSSGLEENWVGVRPLGEGGNGMAGLWELRGQDGQVIKVRICVH